MIISIKGIIKKHPPSLFELIIKGRRIKYFFGVYHTITLPSTEGCETKYSIFLHYKDSKQMAALTDYH